MYYSTNNQSIRVGDSVRVIRSIEGKFHNQKENWFGKVTQDEGSGMYLVERTNGNSALVSHKHITFITHFL